MMNNKKDIKIKIIKRDGRKVKYDREKIVNAVTAAFNSVDGEITSEAKKVGTRIANYVESLNKKTMYVEDIQDIVRDKLMDGKRKDVAECFVIYRENRALARENTIEKDINEIIHGTSEYWNGENSNKNSQTNTTQRDYIAGVVSTDISKRRLLSKDIVKAHNEGIIHVHDLDYFIQSGMYNCCLVNLEDMLQNTTVISGTLIDKPTDFSTACTITTQIISQVASNQYGGQTITISHLSPFVEVARQTLKRKHPDFTDRQIESLVLNDIKDGVQTLQYQVITLMTTNGQAPFITFFLDINEVSEDIKSDHALVIKEILEQRYKGVKNEKGVYITPAFPKLIYLLDDNNTYEDSEYFWLTKIAAKCSAKRLVPDYISAKIMRKYKNGDIYPCMGCRSFLTPDRTTKNYANALNYDKYINHKYYGRLNQGVVTINLVDVACSSKKDKTEFWKILDERLDLCHKALRARHERLKDTTTKVAPILWEHGAIARLPRGSKINELLYHGYSTISLGYAGLYEMCVYMTGKSHTDPEAKPFALAVMQRLNDKCAEWKIAEDIDYSVYGTPIESTTYKFATCLQKRFGKIKDVTDHDYITNSYHVCVREEIDAFRKLEFEAEFQQLSPGGAISYIETANLQNNIKAVISVIQYIYEHIMYAELNTKSDYCQVCGYDGEIQIKEDDGTGKLIWECPNCGNRDQNKLNVARRTCGKF